MFFFVVAIVCVLAIVWCNFFRLLAHTIERCSVRLVEINSNRAYCTSCETMIIFFLLISAYCKFPSLHTITQSAIVCIIILYQDLIIQSQMIQSCAKICAHSNILFGFVDLHVNKSIEISVVCFERHTTICRINYERGWLYW